MALSGEPFVPEMITVHLGAPDSDAPDVTVTFPDYIKNVASCESHPTWPEPALRASLAVQVSRALSRVYSGWYRSRGHDFDITSTAAHDQTYLPGHAVYENVSLLVDEAFDGYIRQRGGDTPLLPAVCAGEDGEGEGLSRWGSVDLARRGYAAADILQHYYGKSVDPAGRAPVRIPSPPYPGAPLGEGDAGSGVRTIQVQLNRISRSYPQIPKITPVDAVFDAGTADAVRAFQQSAGLPQSGSVDAATWYRIAYRYLAVKRISELDSQRLTLAGVPQQYPGELGQDDSGAGVVMTQYFLAVVGQFDERVPPIDITGAFGPETAAALTAFQRAASLPPTGRMDRSAWQELYRAYRGVMERVPLSGGVALYPGEALSQGSQGETVRQLQRYLSVIAGYYPQIPRVALSGQYGPQTQAAVLRFQDQFGLSADGIVGPDTWGTIAEAYSVLSAGAQRQPGQYPGYEMGETV